MIPLEKLLQPLSSEAPCGADLGDDPDMFALKDLATPREGGQNFGGGVTGAEEGAALDSSEPDWKAVRVLALKMFDKGKHLRAAALLLKAIVRLDGPAGLHDGLRLLSGLLEQHWKTLFPSLLDDDYAEDPSFRMGIVQDLAADRAFLKAVRQMPPANPLMGGSMSLEELAAAWATPAHRSDKNLAAAAESARAEITASLAALDQSTETLRSLENFLDQAVGRDESPNLEPFRKTIEDTRRAADGVLARISAAPEPEPPAPAARPGLMQRVGQMLGVTATTSASSATNPASAMSASASSATPATPGLGIAHGGNDITSNEDIVAALKKIMAYYDAYEPSSPIPQLLKRPARLVGKSFWEINDELNPDARSHYEHLFGRDPEPES